MSNRQQQMPTPAEKPEGLQVEPKPEASSSGPIPSNEKKVKQPSGGIEVVALGKGFFRNSRKKIGDKFVVPSLDQVGDWMKCTDKAAEVEHQKLIQARKEELKKAAESKLAK
jgi:hypothetical protein